MKKKSFEENVFSIVRNFAEYGYYGKLEKNAIKTLHKHCPEKELSECAITFRNFLSVYYDTIGFIDMNKDYYIKLHSKPEQEKTIREMAGEKEFIAQHLVIPEKWVKVMIGWIYHWHYER